MESKTIQFNEWAGQPKETFNLYATNNFVGLVGKGQISVLYKITDPVFALTGWALRTFKGQKGLIHSSGSLEKDSFHNIQYIFHGYHHESLDQIKERYDIHTVRGLTSLLAAKRKQPKVGSDSVKKQIEEVVEERLELIISPESKYRLTELEIFFHPLAADAVEKVLKANEYLSL